MAHFFNRGRSRRHLLRFHRRRRLLGGSGSWLRFGSGGGGSRNFLQWATNGGFLGCGSLRGGGLKECTI